MPPTERRSPLIVFAKAPTPGEVKTRLIPRLGAEGAAALHARLIKHTLRTASAAARGALELHADRVDDDFLRYAAARYNALLRPQQGSGLGERMRHAFEVALLAERHPRAVLIGTDCPALAAKHLRIAMRTLVGDVDAVFAPAEDGGYVLIGLARYDAALFENIEWSSEQVMGQTRDRLRHMGWRWVELETLWDVDRPADCARLEESGLLSPRAARPHRGPGTS